MQLVGLGSLVVLAHSCEWLALHQSDDLSRMYPPLTLWKLGFLHSGSH